LDGCRAARDRLRRARTGTLDVDVEPLPPLLRDLVLLAVDHEPVDPRERGLYHKTTLREPYDRRRRRRPDVDDVIMVNTRGELTEATRATLAVQLDGRWWTPPQESGCLPGVERARLLDLGLLRERVLRPADLDRALGLAVVSSLRGWRTAELNRPRQLRGQLDTHRGGMAASRRFLPSFLSPVGASGSLFRSECRMTQRDGGSVMKPPP
jgi:para-aminobenzoate synthetase/4-amino-4-deoxychorismate lyase